MSAMDQGSIEAENLGSTDAEPRHVSVVRRVFIVGCSTLIDFSGINRTNKTLYFRLITQCAAWIIR